MILESSHLNWQALPRCESSVSPLQYALFISIKLINTLKQKFILKCLCQMVFLNNQVFLWWTEITSRSPAFIWGSIIYSNVLYIYYILYIIYICNCYHMIQSAIWLIFSKFLIFCNLYYIFCTLHLPLFWSYWYSNKKNDDIN